MASGKQRFTSSLLGIIVILALVTVFTLQNANTVSVQVYFWEISTSRAMLIFSILLAGVVMGWFARASWARRH